MRFLIFVFTCLLLWPQHSLAQDKPAHKWRLATAWPGGGLFDLSNMWAERVEALTGGRIDVQVFPGGALGNALKVPETVKNGVAEAGHTWASYDWGRDKTGALFGGWPGGPDGEQVFHWLYEGEGQDLFRQWRQEEYGLVSFVAGVSTPEVFLHSKKPINTLADLQGLKMRAAGSWLEMANELGAAAVTAAGSEVFQMLERGHIEATEWANPSVNEPMGFQQVAEYIIMPGYHQPVEVFDVVINQRAWDKLSEQDRKMVELASKLVSFEYWTLCGAGDIATLERFEGSGNKLITLDPAVGEKVLSIANAWADKEAAQNEFFAKVLNSQREFLTLWEKHESSRDLR